jgi:hypothetical protein
MTHQFEKDPTEFFTVVGAPYVHESRAERETRDYQPPERPPEIGVAVLWLFLYVAIIGISVLAHSGADGLASLAQYVMR